MSKLFEDLMGKDCRLPIGTLLSSGMEAVMVVLANSKKPLLSVEIQKILNIRFSGVRIERQALSALLSLMAKWELIVTAVGNGDNNGKRGGLVHRHSLSSIGEFKFLMAKRFACEVTETYIDGDIGVDKKTLSVASVMSSDRIVILVILYDDGGAMAPDEIYKAIHSRFRSVSMDRVAFETALAYVKRKGLINEIPSKAGQKVSVRFRKCLLSSNAIDKLFLAVEFARDFLK
jgi:hypothetical protein